VNNIVENNKINGKSNERFSDMNWQAMPDDRGHFGIHGGRFVAGTLGGGIESL